MAVFNGLAMGSGASRISSYKLLLVKYQTNWKTRQHSFALSATVTTLTSPTSYEAALKQQKHDRSVADENNHALILDILEASATKRDARAYLKRFEPRKSAKDRTIPSNKPMTAGLNLGEFFASTQVAVDNKTIPATIREVDNAAEWKGERLHVALVKVRDPQNIEDGILRRIMHTLDQLSRLGMQIVVIVDCNDETIRKDKVKARNLAAEQADRIVASIDSLKSNGARRLDSAISNSTKLQGQPGGRLHVSHRDFLLSALRRSMIAVIAPIGFNSDFGTNEILPANEVVLALTREFAGISSAQHGGEDDHNELARKIKVLQSETSLDRIIVLDPLGGTPHEHQDGAHRYVNLEQEYDTLTESLNENPNIQNVRHADNLSLMKSALALLPSSSSGFITTPSAVAKSDTASASSDQGPDVGTRRQRNPLIHNLLTNKTAVSFSLPQHRLETTSIAAMGNTSTLLKRGMSLTIIPELPPGGWTNAAQQHQHQQHQQFQTTAISPPNLGLRDPRINYQRLTHLINDSFNRTLDIKAYDSRTRHTLAGVIIAGDYQGAAIFTWELPPPEYNVGDSPLYPWVPYLDKFAVLRSAQGTATADVLWNAMTQAFPQGFCWRSRTVNPVNKWYFERSRGSWQLPGTQWTMFWTTPGVMAEEEGGEGEEGQRLWRAYLGVCRSVPPSWLDARAVD